MGAEHVDPGSNHEIKERKKAKGWFNEGKEWSKDYEKTEQKRKNRSSNMSRSSSISNIDSNSSEKGNTSREGRQTSNKKT